MAFFKKQPKTCNKCGKPLSGKYRECKDCRKLYDTQRYSEQKQQIISRNVQRKRDLIDWYRTLKINKPCSRCGIGGLEPCQLDFDHLPTHRKRFEISWAVRNGISKDRIQQELNGCWLICANCHRLLTHNRLQAKSNG